MALGSSKESFDTLFDTILDIHNSIIKNSGGESGIRDEGGLHNSLYKIVNYQQKHKGNPAIIAAFIYQELARRHHFMDGNKRTAHVVAKLFLFIEGYTIRIQYKEAVPFIIEIAKYESTLSFQQIKEWVEGHLEKLEQKVFKWENEPI